MIAPEGNPNAQIAIIGEALGRQELEQSRAFVGPSGKLLFYTLSKYKIRRSDCYITNVIPNSIIQDPLTTLSQPKLGAYINDLRTCLDATHCNIYITLGRTALYALTGEQSINSWRGSIMATYNGRKCLPTLHPAYILRQPNQLLYFNRDIATAIDQSKFPEIILPQRTLNVSPTKTEVLEFISAILFRAALDNDMILTADIETDGIGALTCIALSIDPTYAISIPLWGQEYWPPQDYLEVWNALKILFASRLLTKEFHNGSFDTWGLKSIGVPVAPPLRDTMYLHHALDPVAPPGIDQKPHSLATVNSLYTLQPWYKDWDIIPGGKKSGIPHAVNRSLTERQRALREYNAIDACVTRESSIKMTHKLSASQKILYDRHYSRLQPYLIKMCEEGLSIDKPLAISLATALRARAAEIETMLSRTAGEKVTVSSPKKLMSILYDVLPFPKQYRRDKNKQKVLTSNDEALVQIYLQTQGSPLGQLALIIRDAKEYYKYASFLDPAGKDAKRKRKTSDGRIRTEYRPTTKTLRLASSSITGVRNGINLQNIPSFVRQVFVPPPGHIFLEPDYRQAEAMVIAWDSVDADMMHKFELSRSDPLGYDIHYINAEVIMGRERFHLTKEDRSACKHVVYGTYYKMAERKLQETILSLATDSTKPYEIPGVGFAFAPLYLPLSECKSRQNRFKSLVPKMLEWQSGIEHILRVSGTITNCFGFTVHYHDIITDPNLKYLFGYREKNFYDTLKEALAMIPQSTIGILCCQSLMNVEDALRANNIGRVAAQVHDSLLLEIKDDWASLEQAFNLTKTLMEREVIIKGNKLIVPTEFKLGYSWKGEREKIFTVDDLHAAYQAIRKE